MTIVGLLAWFCLLMSAFAHLATYFVGGTFNSVLASAPMAVGWVLVWTGAWRQARADGTTPWRSLSVKARAFWVLGVVYVACIFGGAWAQSAPPSDGRTYGLTYDGSLRGDAGEAYREYGLRLDARKWTGFWTVAFLAPVLFYNSRKSDPISS